MRINSHQDRDERGERCERRRKKNIVWFVTPVSASRFLHNIHCSSRLVSPYVRFLLPVYPDRGRQLSYVNQPKHLVRKLDFQGKRTEARCTHIAESGD